MFYQRFIGAYPGYPFNNGIPYPQAMPVAAAASAPSAAAAGAANSAASSGAAQSAFSHFPHPPPNASGAPPHFPHSYGGGPYPYDAYASLRRSCRPRGPRLLPLLVVGGAGLWGYHHMKHVVWELWDEVQGLKSVVFAQGAAAASAGGQSPPPPSAVVREEPKTGRGRRWERRWGEKGENVVSVVFPETKLV